MAEDPGSVARPLVEVRPLLRAIGIASDPRKLILAAVGAFATITGWALVDHHFGPGSLGHAQLGPGPILGAFRGPIGESIVEAGRLVTEPPRAIVGPFASLFSRGIGPAGWSRAALMGLWAVTVSGIFGGAIARIAVVQAASGRRVGVGSALGFALRKSGSLIGAPLTPMLAVAVFSSFLAAFGLIYRIPRGIGPGVAGFLGFVPLLVGLVMALILLGLAAGWPLMLATVAAEGEDAADALSRSYSYVNQRLARYLAHLAAAWGIGTLGLLGVVVFARVVLALADWGVALGAPGTGPSDDLPPLVGPFWVQLVGWLVHGWIYSFFWSATSIIYLILRRDVDGADWHDVYLPEHDADTFSGEPGPAASPTPESVGSEAT